MRKETKRWLDHNEIYVEISFEMFVLRVSRKLKNRKFMKHLKYVVIFEPTYWAKVIVDQENLPVALKRQVVGPKIE